MIARLSRAALAALALLTITLSLPGCEDDPPAPVGPLTSSDAPGGGEGQLQVTIVGAGSVSYAGGGAGPCTSPGGSYSCPAQQFTGNSTTITATPAAGWKLDGWATTFADSPNGISNPKQASQTVVAGTSVVLTVTFVPLVKPIQATFVQQAFMTTYLLQVENPDLDIIKVEWSGPNCGTWDPQGAQLGSESTTSFQMTWQHPHPNCAPTTDHKDVTVRAKVTIKDKTFTCEYVGADTGTGNACK